MSKQSIVIIGSALMLFLSGFNLLGSSCTSQNDSIQQEQKVSSSLEDIIKGGAFLVDVRSPAEFADGHVAGSVNIPLVTIQDNIDAFKDRKEIVVFCQSGGRSRRAKNILENNGIENVTNGGGWAAVNAIVKKKQ